MATTFLDSFDDRSASYGDKYTASAGTISTLVAGRTGQGITLTGALSGSLTQTVPTHASTIVGFGIKATNPSISTTFLELLDGSTVQTRLRLNTDSTLSLVRGDDGTVLFTSLNALSSSLWTYLELKVVTGNAGSWSLQLNEYLELSGTGDTQSTAAAQVTAVRLWNGATGITLNLDDLYLGNTSGSVNADFLGAIQIQCLHPTGAGAATGWVPSTGTNWGSVADTSPDGDTTYIAASAVGVRDTYDFGLLTGSITSILGVQVGLVARKDDANIRKIRPIVRHGNNDYAGADVTLTTSYQTASQLFMTPPGSGAWTVALLNAAEFGADVST